MKTTINTKKICGCLGAIVFLAALSTSCKIPSADSISAPPAGTINVKFGAASTSSTSKRTAVPDLAANVAVYIITCANAATGASSTAEISGTTTHEFTNIVPGNVTISVSAYSNATTKDATTLIATGSSSITLGSGEGANVTVQLAMVASGTPGGFSLNIQWPTALATSVDWKLDSGAQTAPTCTSSNGTSSATIAASSISAGSHVLTILFKNGATTVGMAIETVNVYANLTSTKWVDSSGNLVDARTFTTNDFASSGTDLSLRITTGSNYYTTTFSSSKTSDTIWVPSTATGIAVILFTGTTGQTLSYTWNGGAVTNATEGDLQTLSYPGSATNFVVTVTDPAGSSSRTYTLTVNTATAISSTTELAGMSGAGNYVLTADIDLSSYGTWTPTGSTATPFTGSFDGGGHTISNLSVSTATGDGGLFGFINSPAVISNVRLKNIALSSTVGDASTDGVGGIVGENYGGTVTRCSVSGIISGKAWRVGGIVGNNRSGGIVSECYSTATVTTTGWFAGGLVGWNWGTIENCYAKGAISGNSSVGGLVEMNLSNSPTATISNCYSASSVSYLSSGTSIGGLMARNYGTDSQNYYDSTVSNCGANGYGTAKTSAEMKTQSTYSGWNFDSIWAIDPRKNNGYPYLRALPIPDDITIPSGTTAAALQSLLNTNMDGNFILSDDITLSGTWTPVGTETAPFIGTFEGNGHWITGLDIQGGTIFGCGFFGETGPSAVIQNLTLKNVVVVQANGQNDTGALSGRNLGLIYHCSASGSVTCTAVGAIGGLNGGLVGQNGTSGIILECYSTVIFFSPNYCSQDGGLVGSNFGYIANCYARGAVTATTGPYVGGFAGINQATGIISNSYATGNAFGVSSVGGFAGVNSGSSFTDCYYEGTPNNSLGTQKTSDEMKTSSTFGSWDFANVWGVNGSINGGYPYLKYFGSSTMTP